MARKRTKPQPNRETFWTQDRLAELKRMFATHTIPQLEKHFHKTTENIMKAYEFKCSHDRLKVRTVKRNGYVITFYAAVYAENAYRSNVSK